MDNKVKFGLKNVHYAKITYGENGAITYATPVRIPGAVSLTMDPQGDLIDFYADDGLYYAGAENMGYKGTLEIALVPDSFKTEILGDKVDEETGVLVESTDAKTSDFALLFEIDGDAKARRVVLYDCYAARTAIGGQTKTKSTSPATESLSLTAIPLPSGIVKGQTTNSTTKETYDAWYDGVTVPTVEEE
ncbi:MAG: phage tail protein [Oscillospiraceae bacterium]|nr:phage tail protein [Oscillospiraceae bacterium]